MGSDILIDILKGLIFPVLAGVMSYGAIRQDIKSIHEKLKDTGGDMKREIDRLEQTALRAHSRLDEHVVDYHRGK